MIEHISGKIVEINTNYIVIENQNIGYKLNIPNNYSLDKNQTKKFYIHTIYKEDSRSLFGFILKEHRSIFTELLSVSGVGGASALAILSNIGFEGIVKCVKERNSNIISTTKGIGKKTAEKIIVELKNKFDKIETQSTESNNISSEVIEEAVSALVNLGINKTVATKTVNKSLKEIGEKSTLEEVIRYSLSKI